MHQKKMWAFAIILIGATLPGAVFAQTFISGSTGADGPFVSPCSPPCIVTLPLPPNGVFNFTTVNVPAQTTLRFSRNVLNTPVFMLATGDVTVDGLIDVSGTNSTGFTGGQGGPGGFDGGSLNPLVNGPSGAGLGPGGGSAGPPPLACGFGGGFGTSGAPPLGGGTYGNEFLVPLIGGSGGGGGGGGGVSPPFNSAMGGGGGGGALLIASSGTLSLNQAIDAKGGSGSNFPSITVLHGGAGSGGAVRLVATTIAGRLDRINVSGEGGFQCASTNASGRGRIRVEFIKNALGLQIPTDISLGRPSAVFVPNNPTLGIVSIDGTPVPPSPAGSYTNPDISLPPTTTSPVTVNLAATNIPVGTPITVTVTPQFGAISSTTSTPLTGTIANTTATANVDLPVGSGTSVVLMVQASFAIQVTAVDIPGYEGVKFARVNVKTTMSGESAITYVTDTGREIPASEVGPLLYAKVEESGVK